MKQVICSTISSPLQLVDKAFTLVLALLLMTGNTFGQIGQQGTFLQNESTTKIGAKGVYYTDYTVPSAGSFPYLWLSARGADGGKADIQDIFGKVIRTGKGGQGATLSAYYKIGTGPTDLKPGSKIRVIVGMAGQSAKNAWGSLIDPRGGGGGGTGILYLPAGVDEKQPSNWKLLMVAGGGGGGGADTDDKNSYWHGKPGQISESGFQYEEFQSEDIELLHISGPDLDDVFGHQGMGGFNFSESGAGGGTSHETWGQFSARTAAQPHLYGPSYEIWCEDVKGGYPEKLMGEGLDLLCKHTPCVSTIGQGLFQYVNQVPMPIGGTGGRGNSDGGYGGGGGGAGRAQAGGGGGYSGGCAGLFQNLEEPRPETPTLRTYQPAGGGGGSYINTEWALPGTIDKKMNASTSNTSHGYIYYHFSSAIPAFLSYQEFTSSTYLLKSGPYTLSWQGDGNLVIYESGMARWASGTNGQGATKLSFQGDGNLVIYAGSKAIWSSGTNGKGGSQLRLSPSGTLAIINGDDQIIWSVK